MNTKSIKAILMAFLFGGAFTITACDTGTDPGDVNHEESDHVDEGSLIESDTDNKDTANLERYYDDAEGAVHAGDGQSDGVDRGDIDDK
jgi:hypothetical protein